MLLAATVMQKPVEPGLLRSTVRNLLASQQQPVAEASNQ